MEPITRLTSEWAFYQASQAAFAEVSEDGIWQLLEPVMSLEVNSPNEFTSGIFGLITGRAGIITGQDGRDDWFTLEAEVPLNNMFGFSAALRSATQGMRLPQLKLRTRLWRSIGRSWSRRQSRRKERRKRIDVTSYSQRICFQLFWKSKMLSQVLQ